MKFYEHHAKAIFAQHGIPVPQGLVVDSMEAFKRKRFPYPAAVKAQVLVGGRGKAGGIAFADNGAQARRAIRRILGMTIGGYTVRQVLLEEKLDVERELYLSYALDRGRRAVLLMASPDGGVDIESVPEERLLKRWVTPTVGLPAYVLRDLRRFLGLADAAGKQLDDIARRAWNAFVAEDGELLEINPLVLTRDCRLVAGDAKLVVDDSALYRHPEYQNLEQDLTPLEAEARAKGIAFIQLGGNIGVIANGAGLTMATLDVLNLKGGKGGVFLDLGGTDDPEKVKEAFTLLAKANPSLILMNIFGGITKCDTVALGVKEAFEALQIKIPVVARIKGRNEEEAKAILRGVGLHPADTMEEAAELAVRMGVAG